MPNNISIMLNLLVRANILFFELQFFTSEQFHLPNAHVSMQINKISI